MSDTTRLLLFAAVGLIKRLLTEPTIEDKKAGAAFIEAYDREHKRQVECPAGHRFGTDHNRTDDCDDCPDYWTCKRARDYSVK